VRVFEARIWAWSFGSRPPDYSLVSHQATDVGLYELLHLFLNSADFYRWCIQTSRLILSPLPSALIPVLLIEPESAQVEDLSANERMPVHVWITSEYLAKCLYRGRFEERA